MPIRPVRDGDWDAVAEISSAVKPEPVSSRELKAYHHMDVTIHTSEWAVYTNDTGEVLGFSPRTKYTFLPPGHCSVGIQVHPGYRQQGIGTALLDDTIRWAKEHECNVLRVFCQGYDTGSIAWVMRRGFCVHKERTEAVLDINDWDPARFDQDVAQVEKNGFRIEVLEDVTEPEELMRGYYNVCARTIKDVPAAADEEPMDYDSFVREIKSEPRKSLFALAFDGDVVVAVAKMSLPEIEGQSVWNDYTATLPEYRGRGLALSVKVAGTNEIAARGYNRLRTNNDPDNPAMLKVNSRLGYKAVPGPIRLVKEI